MRVLIYDQDYLSAWTLENYARSACCAIVGPFEKPNEAILALAFVDAALIDVSSASPSGLAVAEAAKLLGIPILIVTTLSRAFETTFPDAVLLNKPFTATQLKIVMEKLRTSLATKPAQHQKP